MRTLRSVALSLALTLMLLALGAVKAHGVFAGEDPAPPPPPLPTLATMPAAPCADAPYTLLAIVPRLCPPCLTSIHWEAVSGDHVRLSIRATACSMGDECPPDTVRIPMPGVPRSGWPVRVQVHSVLVFPDITLDSVVVDTDLIHVVRPAPCDYVRPISLASAVWIDGKAACDSCPPITTCSDRRIRVRLHGEFMDGCGSVRKVEILPSPLAVIGPPTIRVLLDSGQCRGMPCTLNMEPWDVDTVIPGLPPGDYRLPIEVAQVSCSDSILPGRLLRKTLAFRTTVSCSAATRPAVFLHIEPDRPCVGQPVTLVAVVPQCPPCIASITWQQSDPAEPGLTIRWFECATFAPCPPATVRIPLGTFQAGAFTLHRLIRSVQLIPGSPADSVVRDTIVTLGFTVERECADVPPIPLRTEVTISGQAACDSACHPAACADRPIPIQIRGTFPSSCGRVRRVEFIPSPLTVIGPPTVRVLLDSEDCLDRPCMEVITPWVVDTVIPGLPYGEYRLPVEVAQVSCSDSILPGRLLRRLLPFSTTATCTTITEPRCFHTEWGPVPLPTGCNATIAPGSEAVVTLGVRSGVPLAGLQGVLRCGPLQVRDLEAVGPAAGMTLQWVPTPEGARFVLFATHGAPIPAYLSTDPRVDPIFPLPPVLKITVGLPAGSSPPPVMWVRSDSLIGADSLARLVPECPDPTMRPMPPGARVCLVTGCDVNGDGRGDVRDLVLMVHCILGGGPCPDTTAGRFDCDGDGLASLNDILCCARTILRGAPPDTTPPIKERGVALRFGTPVKGTGGVSLPLTLEGAEHVGALRMALRFPSDRYDVAGLTSSAGSGWLALHEVRGDEVVVGLIALGPVAGGASVPLSLQLALRPGQTDGGEVMVTEADLSAPDGAALDTDLPGSGTLIEAPGTSSLAIQPNPIVTGPATVRFALTRATTVDVGVYDIAGRRVATLATGALAAGVHTRSWDAQGARDGVYFVRMRADGVEVAHKAVLRRGR